MSASYYLCIALACGLIDLWLLRRRRWSPATKLVAAALLGLLVVPGLHVAIVIARPPEDLDGDGDGDLDGDGDVSGWGVGGSTPAQYTLREIEPPPDSETTTAGVGAGRPDQLDPTRTLSTAAAVAKFETLI